MGEVVPGRVIPIEIVAAEVVPGKLVPIEIVTAGMVAGGLVRITAGVIAPEVVTCELAAGEVVASGHGQVELPFAKSGDPLVHMCSGTREHLFIDCF